MVKNETSARAADTARAAGSGRNMYIQITADELSEIIVASIQKAVSSIKVYVLESDITAAQDGVKAIVEQSRF